MKILFFTIMLCLYKQKKRCKNVMWKLLWWHYSQVRSHLTFTSILTRKPNAVKSFRLLMAPGKLPNSLPNAKLFGIAKSDNTF